ncbi:accessory Sec system protein Asp3 [Staphylococcus agnetis]|uniref:Accessory Sec system protein Asp3 n=1 Tax=Staphylococcus agnetis TaxID=985762 RepID=A0ABD7TUP6_9STAP|nr:accessory Sec system protein Asp3 [Staphylococcus agnetis]UXU57419.1 accessory Sec system protein Asp3 [Staphylococcus agnetis]
MQNHNYTIRWTQIIPNTFMYGSRLHFNHHETIFKNRLMPSGIVIHEWKMMTNYAEEKTIPTLPILNRGATYHFSFDYDVEPSTGIYFKIIFKRRNGTIFDTRIIQQREVAITYPNEAFSYELQMINAAATSVCFRSIKSTIRMRIRIQKCFACRTSSMKIHHCLY